MLKTLPDEIGDKIGKHWLTNTSTPQAKWDALKSLSVKAQFYRAGVTF